MLLTVLKRNTSGREKGYKESGEEALGETIGLIE